MSKSPQNRRPAPVDPADRLDPGSGSGEWVVACRVCGRQPVVEPAEMNGYLAHGWPTCCGREMVPALRPVGD